MAEQLFTPKQVASPLETIGTPSMDIRLRVKVPWKYPPIREYLMVIPSRRQGLLREERSEGSRRQNQESMNKKVIEGLVSEAR